MVEVRGEKVDIIAVSVSQTYEDPERAWWFRPVFDVSETDDREYIAREIAKEVVNNISEIYDEEDYPWEQREEDREAIEELLLYLLEEAPEEPEKWTMVLPSEIAYVSVDFYTITKKLKEVVK